MADTYKILSQKQDVVLNPAGTNFDDIWEITYQVTNGASKGTTGTVKVPESDHNAKYVDGAIREKIADLHGIASLGG